MSVEFWRDWPLWWKREKGSHLTRADFDAAMAECPPQHYSHGRVNRPGALMTEWEKMTFNGKPIVWDERVEPRRGIVVDEDPNAPYWHPSPLMHRGLRRAFYEMGVDRVINRQPGYTTRNVAANAFRNWWYNQTGESHMSDKRTFYERLYRWSAQEIDRKIQNALEHERVKTKRTAQGEAWDIVKEEGRETQGWFGLKKWFSLAQMVGGIWRAVHAIILKLGYSPEAAFSHSKLVPYGQGEEAAPQPGLLLPGLSTTPMDAWFDPLQAQVNAIASKVAQNYGLAGAMGRRHDTEIGVNSHELEVLTCAVGELEILVTNLHERLDCLTDGAHGHIDCGQDDA